MEESNQLEDQRYLKLKSLYSKNIDPYPNNFIREYNISEILEKNFSSNNDQIAEENTSVKTAGRITSKRLMGKAGFLRIEDQKASIQLYGNNKLLDEKDYFVFQQIDIGDIVGVAGQPFYTKTNEPSLRLNSFQLLSKNLSTLPIVKEKEGKVFDSFSDIETRYRKRYVDILVNQGVKKDFIIRSEVIKSLREFLINRDFIELETPMMQPVASGAAAKPFKTHHNALNIPLYLRIAPELYLKRLIVGGFEKVFEINRNFRNEGISNKHNPEFTMMELYQAYSNYETMMNLTEDIFEYISMNVLGKLDIEYGEHTISLKKPWPRKKYLESIHEKTGMDFNSFLNQKEPSTEKAKKMVLDFLSSRPSKRQIKINETKTFWEVVDLVFSNFVEPELIQPVFITHFPKSISPLARVLPSNPHLVERFEPYIIGGEMGNAFSELNDPIEQEKRFRQQTELQKEGASETVPSDEDFLEALRVGMPPTGGLGLGIDRMVMLFTNKSSIKDVILFPLLRPK